MKVLIVEVKPNNKKKCINKDLAGGMGTGTWVGESLKARIFEYTKKNSVLIPNITIAYLIAIFKERNWEVEFEEIQDIKNFKNSSDLILVHTSIVDSEHELEIIKKIKNKNNLVGAFGSFASAVPNFFSEYVDFVIKGEAESGIYNILNSGKFPKGIYEVNLVENINKLPFPDWDMFDIKKYSYFPALYKKPVLTMLTSRGCPYSCSFYCPYTLSAGKKWRNRNFENIVEEIEYLIKNYKIKAIDFRDAIFTMDRERTLELAEEIKRKNLKFIWSCETRLDRLDKDLIAKMKEAGLRHLNVGIESYNPEILKEQKRLPINLKHQEDIINFCHNNGISIAAFYIIGMEEDTKKTVLNTISYAKKLNTLVAQFAISTPYPGTEYYKNLKEHDRIKNLSWDNFDEYTPIIKHKNLSDQELLQLKEQAFVSYYFGANYILKNYPKIIKRKIICLFS